MLWYFADSFVWVAFLFAGNANVTIILKGQPSSSASNYQPISITPILSKAFEHLVSVCLGCYMECRGVLPTTQITYSKGLGTCDALLCMGHTLQRALEMWQEAKLVQIDFSATFDRINHQGILFKLCSGGWRFSAVCSESFSLIGHSMSWSMVVTANWLTWCQGCLREVFWTRSCSSCTRQSFSV